MNVEAKQKLTLGLPRNQQPMFSLTADYLEETLTMYDQIWTATYTICMLLYSSFSQGLTNNYSNDYS